MPFSRSFCYNKVTFKYKGNSSKGLIYDFGGSHYVQRGEMMYGKPDKYYKLDIKKDDFQKWDKILIKAKKKFSKKEYNLCE